MQVPFGFQARRSQIGRQGLYHQKTYLRSLDFYPECYGELPRNLRRGMGAMVSYQFLIKDRWSFENRWERKGRPDGEGPVGC